VHFSFKGFILSLGFVLINAFSISVFAQGTPTATPSPTPPATTATPAAPVVQPTPQTKPGKIDKNTPIVFNAEQVAEGVIIIYGSRNGMNQIKRTTLERGKLTTTELDGSTDVGTYEKRIIRGENTEKDKWRIDQKFPSVDYAMILNTKVFGILGGAVFTPRQEAIDAFEAQIWHSCDALFRYKENGSTLQLQEKQKSLGVEYYVLDVTDKNARKTRFFISTKSLKIMSLEYQQGAIKYVRKFYDYRPAQGLFVPFRTVLIGNDKQVEETTISTVTFGQKVEESFFSES
jgi:hypothetical protein